MSATIARQGGRVQPEQSDTHLGLHMAKMAKGGFACATIEETQYLIKKPCVEVREEKQWGVVFPGHRMLNTAIERHPTMVLGNLMDGCLHYQIGTGMNPQTCKGTSVPPHDPMPCPPQTPSVPPVPPGDIEGAHSVEIGGVLPGYVYMHPSPPNAQFFNYDAYAKDCKCDQDCIPDLLTDKGTSTG